MLMDLLFHDRVLLCSVSSEGTKKYPVVLTGSQKGFTAYFLLIQAPCFLVVISPPPPLLLLLLLLHLCPDVFDQKQMKPSPRHKLVVSSSITLSALALCFYCSANVTLIFHRSM